MGFIKYIFSCLYHAILNTVNDDGVEHAGYMSFMVLFSLFPFLVFFLSFTSVLGASNIGENFIQILLENLPAKTTDAIRDRINELINLPPPRILTLAIVGTIWTASSFVEGLRTILNRVYRIKTPPPYLWRRMMSIAQFLMLSIILFLIMIFLVMIPLVLNKLTAFGTLIHKYDFLFIHTRYTLIFLSIAGTVSTLYYIIPNITLKIVEVVPGALVTTVLWMASGDILGRYIDYYSQLNLVYGSLGGIIICLLFFYIINMIFIYGAELNYLLFKNDIPAQPKFEPTLPISFDK